MEVLQIISIKSWSALLKNTAIEFPYFQDKTYRPVPKQAAEEQKENLHRYGRGGDGSEPERGHQLATYLH